MRHLTPPFAIGALRRGKQIEQFLAELIGIADKTAVKWATLAARDWSTYIAQRNS